MVPIDPRPRAHTSHSATFFLGSRILLATSAGLLTLNALPSAAQDAAASANSPVSADAKPLAFDVISVRPNIHGGSTGVTGGGDGIYIRNIPLRRIVNLAYDVKLRSLISGLPDWAGSEHFDITGKVGQSDIAAFQKLGNAFQLLQPILADRFKMQSHFETREMPVYELVLDKNGPKFAAAEFALAPGGEHEVGMSSDKGEIRTMGVPIDRFTQALSTQLGRPVIDKTGLRGHYAFNLTWSPDSEASTTDTAPPADISGPSIFTAVQEQLGLKLQSAKDPVKILVVDHIEQPSAN
jgi:uncharacterized protein (TIGR03435 family)